MAVIHTGNMQPGLDYEEHDGVLNAKKVSLLSGATIYAVVNTGAAGVGNSIVTIANTPTFTTTVPFANYANSASTLSVTGFMTPNSKFWGA